MGMTAGLYLMSPEAFERCREDPNGNHFPSKARAFDIDKAHDLFQRFLDDMPEPLSYAILGDYCPAPSGDATYCGYVSPEAVQEIAPALEAIQFQEVLAKAQQLGWSKVEQETWRQYYEQNWQSLKEAYRTAAERGAALAVLMC